MKRFFPSLVLAAVTMSGCTQREVPAVPGPPATATADRSQQKERTVNEKWPFPSPENTAVITLSRILDGSKPILYVAHDEDGDWQFLDGDDVSEEDAEMVSLKSIANLDPSIRGLADLPAGWAAERDAVGNPWQRFERE